jgi:hypothetical protein
MQYSVWLGVRYPVGIHQSFQISDSNNGGTSPKVSAMFSGQLFQIELLHKYLCTNHTNIPYSSSLW